MARRRERARKQMMDLDRIMSPEFRRSIESARGTAQILVRRRGAVDEARGIDDVDAIAIVDGCLEGIAEAVGLPIENASVYSDAARTTATVYFAIPESRAKLVMLYDSAGSAVRLELLLGERVAISHPSAVDLAHANVEPEILVDLHFGAEETLAVKKFLRQVGCRPKRPAGPTMSYETTRLEIEPEEEEHGL